MWNRRKKKRNIIPATRSTREIKKEEGRMTNRNVYFKTLRERE